MKILYHFRVRGYGAEGVHIAGIVNAFRQLGHEVAVVSPTDADPTQPSGGGTVSLRARLLHKLADVLPQPFFELMEMAYNFFALGRLQRAAADFAPELIYERYAFFNFAGAWVAQRKRIPLILEINELSGLPRVRPQAFTWLASRIEQYILKRARLIVAVSPCLARRAQSLANLPPAKVLVLPNGVDRAWLEMKSPASRLMEIRRTWNLENRKVVGFVGGLVHWHKLDGLLNVFASLPEETVLVVIGDGPLRGRLLALAEKLHLQRRFCITGMVPHAEVRAWMDVFDVAVIPHANEYRSPIKLFEYMGASCAVVAPRTEPIRAVVNDGANGRLFQPEDWQSLAGVLRELLADPACRHRLGAAARQTIAADYLWEKHAAKILAALGE